MMGAFYVFFFITILLIYELQFILDRQQPRRQAMDGCYSKRRMDGPDDTSRIVWALLYVSLSSIPSLLIYQLLFFFGSMTTSCCPNHDDSKQLMNDPDDHDACIFMFLFLRFYLFTYETLF